MSPSQVLIGLCCTISDSWGALEAVAEMAFAVSTRVFKEDYVHFPESWTIVPRDHLKYKVLLLDLGDGAVVKGEDK